MPCATATPATFAAALRHASGCLALLLSLATTPCWSATAGPDAPLSVANYQPRVIALRHGDAQHMVATLNQIAADLAKTGSAQNAAELGPFIIRADASQNALVLLADAARLSQLEGIIQQLDVAPAQVLIETAIIEVAGDLHSISGVRWSSPAGGDATKEAATSLLFGQLLDSHALAAKPSQTTPQPANSDLAALSQKLLAEQPHNLLSSPQVLTLEQQPGSIAMHHELPSSPAQHAARDAIDVRLTLTTQILADGNLHLALEQALAFQSFSPATGVRPATLRALQRSLVLDNRQVLVIAGQLPDVERDDAGSNPVARFVRLFAVAPAASRQRTLLLLLRPSVLTASRLENAAPVAQQPAGLAMASGRSTALDLRQPQPAVPAQRYSIELVDGSNEAFMHALLKLHPKLPLRVVSATRDGQTRFRVLYGYYLDQQLAEQARQQLPAELPQRRAKIVPL